METGGGAVNCELGPGSLNLGGEFTEKAVSVHRIGFTEYAVVHPTALRGEPLIPRSIRKAAFSIPLLCLLLPFTLLPFSFPSTPAPSSSPRPVWAWAWGVRTWDSLFAHSGDLDSKRKTRINVKCAYPPPKIQRTP